MCNWCAGESDGTTRKYCALGLDTFTEFLESCTVMSFPTLYGEQLVIDGNSVAHLPELLAHRVNMEIAK